MKILPTPPAAPILPVVTAGNLAHTDVTFRFQIAFLWFCFTLSPSPTRQAKKVRHHYCFTLLMLEGAGPYRNIYVTPVVNRRQQSAHTFQLKVELMVIKFLGCSLLECTSDIRLIYESKF